jgi:cytochrome c nitrite reductase small subunit
MPLPKLAILAAFLAGAFAGLGAFTFDYGEGLSYFSTDPVACKNCHVMNDQYASWSKAPHHCCRRVRRLSSPPRLHPQTHCQGRQRLPHSKGFTFMDRQERDEVEKEKWTRRRRDFS